MTGKLGCCRALAWLAVSAAAEARHRTLCGPRTAAMPRPHRGRPRTASRRRSATGAGTDARAGAGASATPTPPVPPQARPRRAPCRASSAAGNSRARPTREPAGRGSASPAAPVRAPSAAPVAPCRRRRPHQRNGRRRRSSTSTARRLHAPASMRAWSRRSPRPKNGHRGRRADRDAARLPDWAPGKCGIWFSVHATCSICGGAGRGVNANRAVRAARGVRRLQQDIRRAARSRFYSGLRCTPWTATIQPSNSCRSWAELREDRCRRNPQPRGVLRSQAAGAADGGCAEVVKRHTHLPVRVGPSDRTGCSARLALRRGRVAVTREPPAPA